MRVSALSFPDNFSTKFVKKANFYVTAHRSNMLNEVIISPAQNNEENGEYFSNVHWISKGQHYDDKTHSILTTMVAGPKIAEDWHAIWRVRQRIAAQ